MITLSSYIKKVLEESKASEITLDLKIDEDVNVTSSGSQKLRIKLKRK